MDDQGFLDQIEQNIISKKNETDDALKEVEHRAAEMERIRKAMPSTTPAGGVQSKKAVPRKPEKKNPLEDDPRYREYFDRLKKAKGIPTPAGGVSTSAEAPAARAGASDSQKVGPGAIVRFDDGSIGVYKDAVSGRDYALFYFFEPDGQFMPQGVFLQCYQAKVIGNLPEKYFAALRDDSEWNRDVLVFHLSDYEHVKLLDGLSAHEERKPKNTTPVRTPTVNAEPETRETPKPPVENQQAETKPEKPAAQPAPRAAEPEPGPDELVKGRRFEINFGGRKWEAVFWMEDAEGAIVAHSTHGDWSLMRLDLSRFKDSLVLGDVVDEATQQAIAAAV